MGLSYVVSDLLTTKVWIFLLMVVIRIAVSYTIFSEAREIRNIVYSENSFTSGNTLISGIFHGIIINYTGNIVCS